MIILWQKKIIKSLKRMTKQIHRIITTMKIIINKNFSLISFNTSKKANLIK